MPEQAGYERLEKISKLSRSKHPLVNTPRSGIIGSVTSPTDHIRFVVLSSFYSKIVHAPAIGNFFRL